MTCPLGRENPVSKIIESAGRATFNVVFNISIAADVIKTVAARRVACFF